MKVKLRVVRSEGVHKGKALLYASNFGSYLLAPNELYALAFENWFGPEELEIREFSDEPAEVVREVQVEKLVERQMSFEEAAAMNLGLKLMDTARSLERLRKLKEDLVIAKTEAAKAFRSGAEAAQYAFEAAGLSHDTIQHMKESMGYSDDSELGAECPECGEDEYLNPETGLCFDCNETKEDEGDVEGVCDNCGDEFDPLEINFYGHCEDCAEDEDLDEDDDY